MNTPLNIEPAKGWLPAFWTSDDFDVLKNVDKERDLPVLTLLENGLIRDCNEAGAQLLECDSSNLIWQHVSTFLPQLGEVALVNGKRVNPYLSFLSRVGHHFEVISTSGARFFSAVFFNDVEDFGRHCLRVIFRPITPPAI